MIKELKIIQNKQSEKTTLITFTKIYKVDETIHIHTNIYKGNLRLTKVIEKQFNTLFKLVVKHYNLQLKLEPHGKYMTPRVDLDIYVTKDIIHYQWYLAVDKIHSFSDNVFDSKKIKTIYKQMYDRINIEINDLKTKINNHDTGNK